MKTVGYYVDFEGRVVTVVQSDEGLFFNPYSEVLIEEGLMYTSVLCGDWEEEGFRVDDEFVLWDSLLNLAKVLEK